MRYEVKLQEKAGRPMNAFRMNPWRGVRTGLWAQCRDSGQTGQTMHVCAMDIDNSLVPFGPDIMSDVWHIKTNWAIATHLLRHISPDDGVVLVVEYQVDGPWRRDPRPAHCEAREPLGEVMSRVNGRMLASLHVLFAGEILEGWGWRIDVSKDLYPDFLRSRK